MASTGLNFTNLTADNGAVRDLKQLIFLSVLGVDQLGTIFNVLPKQKHGDKVGFVGEFGMVGKASQGCNPTFGTNVIATGEKTWDIKEWEIAEKICYADLEGTLAKVAMRTKTNVADLTGTEYLDYVVMPRLELAVRKMLMRLALFGDNAAETVANGGILQSGVDKGFFTITDGFWKRIYTLVTATAARRTTIEANSQTTFDLQKSKLRESGVATGILDSLIADAPMELRESEGQVIYITQSIKDALNADIRKNNKGSELQWKSIFGGITESEYEGIPIVAIPFMDEVIRSTEGVYTTTTMTSWNKPHRAIYTIKDNLLVGLESENELADLQVWFNQDEQMNKILSKDKLGTLIAQDNLIQVAY